MIKISPTLDKHSLIDLPLLIRCGRSLNNRTVSFLEFLIFNTYTFSSTIETLITICMTRFVYLRIYPSPKVETNDESPNSDQPLMNIFIVASGCVLLSE